VCGVTVSVRPPHVSGRGLWGKFTETLRIWRSLWTAPSETIVQRAAGLELGVIAVYARLARRRLVFATANLSDFEHHKLERNRLYLFLYRLGVRLADVIVVQTQEQVERCEAVFGRRPVLIKSIAPLAEPQIEEPVAFLWVGRLVSYKRPLEYIALARALPEARFWMIGVPIPHLDGDELVAQAVMAECDAVPNLELLPPRPHRSLQRLMKRAVASVNTSDFEGMPNVLLEAWSRGVPALVLSHDPDGVVSRCGLGGFANGSAEELARHARELWVTRGDRSELAQRCQAYVREHHAPDVIAQRWLDVLAIRTAVKRLEPAEHSHRHSDAVTPR
jgi:glycosyltransferase involved in cell wall biosynthesis